MKICKKCIYDERIKNIWFDDYGVCNFCHQIEGLIQQFGTGKEKGRAELNKIIDIIKIKGKGKKYDCVVGVSGGTDSSYLLVWAKENGLRPLAVHYDNTWNTAIATENIRIITKALDVDLYTHVLSNTESNDIVRSTFYASIPGLDIATDLALAEVLYRAASKFNVQFVLEGHSFTEEGVSPLGGSYVDGGLIKSIRNKFSQQKWKTYPLMTFTQFLKWIILYRIKKIRPLWYIDYSKEAVQLYLEQKYGWKNYGGHHLENRLSAFSHSVHKPQKFNLDERNNTLSARVRKGNLNRDEAIAIYSKPPHIEDGLIDYFKKRIGINDSEYERIMSGENKSFIDFKTYKKRFEFLRPLFFLLSKSNLVPTSFYLKYCFPFNKK